MEVAPGLATAPDLTLAYGRVGQVILYVSALKAPSPSDWAHYMTWLKGTVKPGMSIVSIVYERSPGPNATQRKQITDATSACNLRVAVLATSAVVRTMVTAFNWFKEGYKAFAPEELDSALVFLGVPKLSMPEVRQAVHTLLAALDGGGR